MALHFIKKTYISTKKKYICTIVHICQWLNTILPNYNKLMNIIVLLSYYVYNVYLEFLDHNLFICNWPTCGIWWDSCLFDIPTHRNWNRLLLMCER